VLQHFTLSLILYFSFTRHWK